jgi:hypothetical protein
MIMADRNNTTNLSRRAAIASGAALFFLPVKAAVAAVAQPDEETDPIFAAIEAHRIQSALRT